MKSLKKKFVTGGELDLSGDEELERSLNLSDDEIEAQEEEAAEGLLEGGIRPEMADGMDAGTTKGQAEAQLALAMAEKEKFFQDAMGLYPRGRYVKITLSDVRYALYRKFTPEQPILLCRINPSEDNFGFLRLRMKKHMWYTNILKSNDPLIFSMGWRRFQSIPVYVKEDQNDRMRMVKYTPEFDFCEAVIYSSFIP